MTPTAGAKYRLTANLFAIPFGISGLAQAWGAAHLLSLAPTWPRDALWILAAAAWLVLVVAYLAQLRNGRTLAGELADQTYGPFVALAAIAVMLFGGALALHWLAVGRAVFIAGLVPTVLVGACLTGQWVVTDTPFAAWHPGYFLPTAAGGLVASGTSAGLGYRTVAQLMFGYGITCWVFLGAIILTRLLTQPAMPRALATTIAVTVAPPAVAGAAWLGMNGGRVDGVALALAGSLVLFSAVQLRLIPVYRTVAFGPAWWSYSFAYAAAVVYTVRLLSAGHWHGRDALIWALLALTTLGIGALAVRTAWAVARGRFLPPAPATAARPAATEARRESPAMPVSGRRREGGRPAMSDMLDDVAAFLMHRSADDGRSDTTRMAIYAVVGAYQESYDPAQIDDIVRATAARFADHPAYRQEWRPTEAEVARAAPVLERIFREVRAEIDVSDSARPPAT